MTEKIARISRPLTWRREFIAAHNCRCHYCNQLGSLDVGPGARPWHVDHMTAIAVGGADTEDNLTLACERCNVLKGTLPYNNFRNYAKAALWAERENRITEDDLSDLMTKYLGTSEGPWFYLIARDDSKTCELKARPERHLNDQNDHSVAVMTAYEIHRGRGGMRNADFVVLAHRLAPRLIAEVHLLRAELREARGEVDDTVLDTSAA